MEASEKIVEPFTPQQLWPKDKGMHPITQAIVTIIFFHGLQLPDARDAWKTAWTNDSNVCWPQEWLPEDLGEEKVRVLSMSYDSTATKWVKNQGNTENVRDIAFKLVESFVTRERWQLHVAQKIVLIGHSCGGLIVKSLVVMAHEAATHQAAGRQLAIKLHQHKKFMCKSFLANIRGIFFYGVPHSGSMIAEYVKNLNKAGLRLAGIMRNLCPFQKDMEELSIDFKNAIDPETVTLYAFAEELKYKKVLVVPLASAIQLVGRDYLSLHANHVELCRPPSKESLGYAKLLELIELIM